MISIIIPVYRSEKTLERCIQSICNQAYQDWEAIMIVDGPPDASGILADRLSKQDVRIRVIHQENQGVSAARNAGISQAMGEYIAFLDSDDYLTEDALEKLSAAMESQDLDTCDMVIAGFHHLFFGKDVLKLPSMDGKFELKESQKVFLQLYGEQFLNMPWNKLYRRELIQEGFPLTITLGEDLCFNLSYMKQVKNFYVLQEPVCNYIQDDRGTTLSTKRRKDRIAIALELYQRVTSFCEEMFLMKANREEQKKVLLSKLAVEFLDAMENLAFEIPRDSVKRREELTNYKAAWDSVSNNDKPELRLLDYKIIYACFSRGYIYLTDCMIMLRGLIVRLLRH